MRLLCVLSSLFFLYTKAHGEFWGDLVENVKVRVDQGTEFVQLHAIPVIKEKFNETKTKIEEAKIPEKIHTWAKEEAAPKIEENLEKATYILNNLTESANETISNLIEESKTTGFWKKLAIGYYIVINLILFIVMGIDKCSAMNGDWRVSTVQLFLLAIVCGAFGGFIAIFCFWHKIRHPLFTIGFAILTIVDMIALCFIIF